MGASLSIALRDQYDSRRQFWREPKLMDPALAAEIIAKIEKDNGDYPGLCPESDLAASDDHLTFPLDNLELSSISDEKLLEIFLTAPKIHTFGGVDIVRVSKSSSLKLFQGLWFTDDGAGPFATLQDLEDWFNHKIDVCIRVKEISRYVPRFKFKEVVLTHQDIAPANLILDAQDKVWMIDWGCAGAYPPGFEQAAFKRQSGRNREFTDMVLSRLSNLQKHVTGQYMMIGYGLSAGGKL